MNHAKIILVGCISAFVAVTTALLGVTGTIIGSVLSSVLYNVLSEILEKPVTEGNLTSKVGKRRNRRKTVPTQNKKTFSSIFEYEIAYIFPLVVIAIIQLLLLLSFLSEWGFLPGTFLHLYLIIQDLVDNNLYRIMGISLLVMSIYPFILKPDIIKKSHGIMVGIVGLIFVARGFADLHNSVTSLYSIFFHYFDFEIEVIAFILIVGVILRILVSASDNQKQFKKSENNISSRDLDDLQLKHVNQRPRYREPRQSSKEARYFTNNPYERSSKRNNRYSRNQNINESAEDIYFESNEYFDDYKR